MFISRLMNINFQHQQPVRCLAADARPGFHNWVQTVWMETFKELKEPHMVSINTLAPTWTHIWHFSRRVPLLKELISQPELVFAEKMSQCTCGRPPRITVPLMSEPPGLLFI